ncbi:MAG: CpaF family protein [Thermoanaerobacteraceae bacterium]|nr:CpaF family protein [Thermoanaerobacteraceae bacterium]
MPLEFATHDWLKEIERQKEAIIEEVARQLMRDHPELFSGSLAGGSRLDAEALVRNAVFTRDDLTPDEKEDGVRVIMGQLTGYGPLQEFFTGPGAEEVTEVMVNPTPTGPRVFYGMRGRQYAATRTYFKDHEEVKRFAQKICEDAGRPFTADAPIVDAWLRDGSRLSVIGFKASPLGTALTIRKSPLVRPPLPLPALVQNGMMPQFVADFLVDLIVQGHANLGVFGRTDSGKTTVLRSLGEQIDPDERVIIGETSFELSLPSLPNCVNMVEVTYGGQKLVDLARICDVINRSNPDRAIVGEIRGGEVVAASEIAESTSGGFWTTGHAGGVDELRSRLPKMFYRGGMALPKEYVDEQLRAMFHFLVFLDKSFDGKRTLMSVVEVTREGYRTIIRFDEEEFARTKGRVRRWVYETPVTPERLSRLAFRGAEVKPEYVQVHEQYLDTGGGEV